MNGELEEPAKWPADVRNGVCLLAWMIAHGYLDVRVSFRVHEVTGDPLPFSALDDGYMLFGVDNVPDRTVLTVSRELFDQGWMIQIALLTSPNTVARFLMQFWRRAYALSRSGAY